MNRQEQAQQIAQALALLEAVANASQIELQERITTATGSLSGRPVGIMGMGRILGVSRRVDTLERVCSELAGMLEQPPELPLVEIAA